MFSARMGKETDKTGYDFHSGCLRNQSMYAVIAALFAVPSFTCGHFSRWVGEIIGD